MVCNYDDQFCCPFFCKGCTLATFKIDGKIPVSKDKLTSSDNQVEKNFLKVFKRKTGMPKGPVDFLMSSSSIIFSTSAGPTGDK